MFDLFEILAALINASVLKLSPSVRLEETGLNVPNQTASRVAPTRPDVLINYRVAVDKEILDSILCHILKIARRHQASHRQLFQLVAG
jgi:hypothetical protein